MSTTAPPPVPAPGFRPRAAIFQENLRDLRDSWYWFVALGVALIALGFAAVIFACFTTVMTIFVLGWFLLFSGVFYIAGSFYTSCWGGLFLSLLTGVLSIVVGFLAINHPTEIARVYTLLIAAFFFVEGLFRVVGSLLGRFRHWGYMLASGLLSVVLGVMIWQQLPADADWVIGTFVGINMIFSGLSYVALGTHARNLPVGPSPEGAPA